MTPNSLVEKIEKYMKRFLSFPEMNYAFPVALWVIGSYLWPEFDAFPYMVITSNTKRSGKSRLAELISFICSNPCQSGALTAAAMFHKMKESQPTLFFDEAECLSTEAASNMRAVLNMGYRKGQVVIRATKNGTIEYPTYCPKVFILIGDVFDTLRDRSIIVKMRRGEPVERFTYEAVKAEGSQIRSEITDLLGVGEEATGVLKYDIYNKYLNYGKIDFLTDRDEEIWTPILAICSILCPERISELSRIAVDVATLKTAPSTGYAKLAEEEKKTEFKEYAEWLLKDMIQVMTSAKVKALGTVEVIQKLKQIDTAPWRVFRGEGITPHSLSDLLTLLGVKPGNVRIGNGRKDSRVIKGYKLEDLKAVKI